MSLKQFAVLPLEHASSLARIVDLCATLSSENPVSVGLCYRRIRLWCCRTHSVEAGIVTTYFARGMHG